MGVKGCPDSSHHWLVERADVEAAKALDLKYATKRQLACLGIWFANRKLFQTAVLITQ